MKLFKDEKGRVHAYADDGSQDSAIKPGLTAITREEADALRAPAPLTGNTSILSQISTLESSATPRRLREAACGTDGGWLKALDTQIEALRATLTK